MVAIAFDDSVAVLIPQVCMGLHVVVGFPLERCLKCAAELRTRSSRVLSASSRVTSECTLDSVGSVIRCSPDMPV